MKIYFSGSIRGGGDHRKNYSEIISELKKYGVVLTEFVGEVLTNYESSKLPTEEIYNRDTALIRECDVVLADVSIPSLGVGYEIGYAESLKKPIICLYMPIEGIKISAMIKGCPRVKFCEYHNIEEMKEILKKEFQNII
ncbi:MAG: nucleoside 2-deoxyribosyltransferase [Minisyncoccia bacterium]